MGARPVHLGPAAARSAVSQPALPSQHTVGDTRSSGPAKQPLQRQRRPHLQEQLTESQSTMKYAYTAENADP